MRTSPTYRTILDTIGRSGKNKREMIGIIFAHPEHELVKNEIIPFFNYMDIRSGKHVDFFFSGYLNQRELGEIDRVSPVEIELKYSRENVYFSEVLFLELIKDIERLTNWKRTGGVDFLLLDVVQDKGKPSLDFSKAIQIELSLAREKERIPLLSIFFESIFRFCESNARKRRTWALSDNQIPSLALTALENLLPAGLFSLYKTGSIYAVRDLSK